MKKSGVLTVTSDGIFVALGHLFWMKSDRETQEIINFWQSQGYAEALPLPYIRQKGTLIVTRNMEEYGFAQGTGTLDEEVYDIPF